MHVWHSLQEGFSIAPSFFITDQEPGPDGDYLFAMPVGESGMNTLLPDVTNIQLCILSQQQQIRYALLCLCTSVTLYSSMP